jgi:hypothetical protein
MPSRFFRNHTLLAKLDLLRCKNLRLANNIPIYIILPKLQQNKYMTVQKIINVVFVMAS